MVVILTPTWNHQFCWLGVNAVSYEEILCTAQWESICTSSKPNHWAKLGYPYSAQERLWIQPSDLCGCYASLVWDCMPNGQRGDLQHPDQSDIQRCHVASTCWMLELCIPKPVSHQETGISWKTWENYGKPISDHGHDMMHSPWTFVATLVWFIPMLPEAPSGLNAQRSGNPFHQKRKVQRRHWGLFPAKRDMEADCPASGISVLLWAWRYNCPEETPSYWRHINMNI